ncbi:hypothetical protein KVR01_005144 [Diaporthe batatas]|uniref:uncharacterized protein n=1 Tax=Diaporthe batatas TaxID=748121 RepID=UPI001D03A5C6|nr:uncharacterized protein KVR01_005144 [Diaporthe batatas]KAG8164869.1 hypothetical protein KVR01_005144 [Diaporthe batatas]
MGLAIIPSILGRAGRAGRPMFFNKRSASDELLNESCAAALAHQISHRNTFFSAPRPQWFRGVRCRPGRGRPFGGPGALLIGHLAYKPHGFRLGRQDDHGLQPLFALQHRLTVARQNHEALAAGGVRCPEIAGAQQNCSRCVPVRTLQTGSLGVAVSGVGLRYTVRQESTSSSRRPWPWPWLDCSYETRTSQTTSRLARALLTLRNNASATLYHLPSGRCCMYMRSAANPCQWTLSRVTPCTPPWP